MQDLKKTDEIKKTKKSFRKGRRNFKIIVSLLVIISVLVGGYYFLFFKPKAEITTGFISSKLEAASELTSAKMIYNGYAEYSDGNVPFLTKKAFLMLYKADVRAGIDLKNVDIQVTPLSVKIAVPEVEIIDIKIDPSSLKFVDKKSAIFNWSNNDDVALALKAAESNLLQNADIEQLKELAKNQINILLTGLFEDCIDERKLEIVQKDSAKKQDVDTSSEAFSESSTD